MRALRSRLHGSSTGNVMGDINVTPMVDIMLVLLIVFIITAPVMHQAFKLNLPQQSADAIKEEPKDVTISVSAEGEYSVGQEIVAGEQLGERLAEFAQADPRTSLHIRADEQARYGDVARILGAARDAGLSRILFIPRPPVNKNR